jgi:hypothetical protein
MKIYLIVVKVLKKKEIRGEDMMNSISQKN